MFLDDACYFLYYLHTSGGFVTKTDTTLSNWLSQPTLYSRMDSHQQHGRLSIEVSWRLSGDAAMFWDFDSICFVPQQLSSSSTNSRSTTSDRRRPHSSCYPSNGQYESFYCNSRPNETSTKSNLHICICSIIKGRHDTWPESTQAEEIYNRHGHQRFPSSPCWKNTQEVSIRTNKQTWEHRTCCHGIINCK